MANEPFSWTGKVDLDGIEELWTVRATSAQDLQARRHQAIAAIHALRDGRMALDAEPDPEPEPRPNSQPPTPRCSACGQKAEYRQGMAGNPPRPWKAWRCPAHGIVNFNKDTGTWDPKDA